MTQQFATTHRHALLQENEKLDTSSVDQNVSKLCIHNCPTRCNTKQSLYYSACSLYMFRVSITPINRITQNCNYSLRYWSYFLCSYLPPTWTIHDKPSQAKPSLAILEGGRCTKNVTSIGGCSYSFCVLLMKATL